MSLWLNVDPLADYNPLYNDQAYIDGEHNGGVYNSGNNNPYIYCYQSPINLIDPNGKQTWGYAMSSVPANQRQHVIRGMNRSYEKSWTLIHDTGAGFVPYYGQLIDIKDTYNAFKGGNGWDISFAMIAWVPGGDFLKGLKKLFKNADNFRQFRHVGDVLDLGKKRENLVAELSGGGVAMVDGKDLVVRTKDGTIGTTIDVIGNNGELISVGGASKAKNGGSAFLSTLANLKRVADDTGATAQTYLSDNTPEWLIKKAQEKLGKDNVKIFKEPR
ncbi:hypothetical protein SRABI04_03213 [Chryseobacterium sp. Bi04]|nr:hypothetical protein SRABI04_03213 [Chryseobacterium sp. Bi04]